MNENLGTYDYFTNFVRTAIRDLKTNGVCYVFNKKHVEEIKKLVNIPLRVTQNECGYTLHIPRKFREEMYYE